VRDELFHRDAPESREDRAVTPTVGKVLEIGLTLLVVTGLVSGLYGGVVPDYRTAAGTELADRVVAGAAERVESAIPPTNRWTHVERRVSLPPTIRGDRYRIVAGEDRLRLQHPTPGVSATGTLTLPDRVVSVTGSWTSSETNIVLVEPAESGLIVRLTNASATNPAEGAA
jgi:hypothetical protein